MSILIKDKKVEVSFHLSEKEWFVPLEIDKGKPTVS